MSSLFERIYRYKQSDKGHLRHSRENFLTEIFAHCLEFDVDFQKKFLKRISCDKEYNKFECKTQVYVNKFLIPDVRIKLDDHSIIFIECKVDSPQGKDQLNKYALFLKDNKVNNKQLIFLTKWPEKTANNEDFLGENFKHIRWYDIFILLKDSSNEISKEFSKYLKEHKMNKSIIPFTTSDLTAIAKVKETMEKMDGFLVQLEHILKDYTKEKIHFPQFNYVVDFSSYAL
ncbi:MAG TPA: PD-(D/E)XK nuclease family protein [Mucilaginibacter sp.]